MIVHDVAQRSPEWVALRLGRLTASRAHDMLATTRSKGEFAASRKNLKVQLVLERLTGRSQERDFQNQAMRDGIDREEAAGACYEALTGRLLWPIGFVAHDYLMAGCSPDGVVGDFEGTVSVKCPIPATHLDFVRSGMVPLEYSRQIQHELWITGAQWCDFLSFQPDFPESLRARVVRLHRNELDVQEYEKAARLFLSEVDLECDSVRTLADMRGTLQAVVA